MLVQPELPGEPDGSGSGRPCSRGAHLWRDDVTTGASGDFQQVLVLFLAFGVFLVFPYVLGLIVLEAHLWS